MAHQTFTAELLAFLWASISHWQTYVTGGTVTGVITVWERLRNKNLSTRAYFLVFVVSFSIAGFFMAWREQYERAQTAEAKLSATPQVQKIDLTLPPAFQRFLEQHTAEAIQPLRVRKPDIDGGGGHTATDHEISNRPKEGEKTKTNEARKPITENAGPAPTSSPLPPVESLQFTQRQISSTDPARPHATELVVQSNVDIDPVSIIVICKSNSCDLQPRFSAINVRIGHVTGHDNWAIIAFEFPRLTPAKPLVIEVDSKDDNEVLSVRRFTF
jgi:hypothetical protein